ncbi:MAG: hypothetical protein KAS67_01215 [Thermoplasmata archaeon]|nr:hypothetical protein [Thermoplasmata archaeon]
MKIIQKLLAMAVMTIMVCASLIIVSPNNTVIAEDSAQVFAGLDTGYPGPGGTLDIDQQAFGGTYFTISGASWRSQSFRPTMGGELAKISLFMALGGGTGSVYFKIYNTDQAESPLAGAVITSEVIPATSIPGPSWFDITFSTPAILNLGTEYAIVMHADASCGIYWYYASSNVYANGGVAFSNDGNGMSWTVNPSVEMAFQTYMNFGPTGITRVAWHESGDFALGVNGFDSEIYKFTRETGAWSLEYTTGAPIDHFADIVYDDVANMFYIVGDSNANPFAYTWDETNGFLDRSSPPTQGIFYGVEVCNNYFDGSYNYGFLAVGRTTLGGAYAAWWSPNYPGGWIEAYSGLDNDELLTDVAWDGQYAGESYYAIGYDTSGYLGVMYSYGIPGDTTATTIFQDNTSIGMLNAIDWCPDYASNDYGLIVGNYFGSADANIWKYNPGSLKALSNEPDNYYDVDWHPDGSLAVIVGENAGSGVVYQHPAGTDNIVDFSWNLAPGTGKLIGVAMKSYTSPSSGLIVGPSGAIGFYPSTEDIGTTITVNSAFPHNFDIDMWKTSDAGRTSKLNQQVNVETTYTFMAEVNYTINGIDQFYADGEDDIWVLLTAWHDNGNVPSSDPDDTDYNRTRNFQAMWQEGPALGADTGGMIYPGGSPGVNEVQYVNSGLEAGPGDHYYVYINLTLGPQLWAADGQGFGNGPSSNINNGALSFNDPDTWDFVMTIVDANYIDAVNSTFEEFGLFRFTNITVSGSPSGNAPPGTISQQLFPNSQINCSSNIPYYVNVSIPRLNKTTDNTKFIPPTDVAIRTTSAFANDTNTQINSTWPVGRPFPGVNQQLGVWGNGSQALSSDWVVPAPLNSTTVHGPQGADYQGLSDTIVQWFVTVPGGTSEGIYRATITFRIGYY